MNVLKVSSDFMITKGHSDRWCGTSSSTRLPNSKYPLWIPVKQQGASACCQKGKSITRNWCADRTWKAQQAMYPDFVSLMKLQKGQIHKKIVTLFFLPSLKFLPKLLKGSKWVFLNYLLVYLPLVLGGQGTHFKTSTEGNYLVILWCKIVPRFNLDLKCVLKPALCGTLVSWHIWPYYTLKVPEKAWNLDALLIIFKIV